MFTSLLSDHHLRHLALTVGTAAGLVLYLSGVLTSLLGFDFALLCALAGGFPIYYAALRGLLFGKLSADCAVALAAIAACAIGQYAVAAEVILIMLIGETLEHAAVRRTRAGIEALLELRPQKVCVVRDGAQLVVPAEEVVAGELVLVRPGERVPVDGRVEHGLSSVDQSPITGESVPADKAPGDQVFAGTLNCHGALQVRCEKVGRDTTLEQIIRLVEEAEAAKAPTERLADRYARYFVPAVLVAAGVTYGVTGEVVRAVSVLVVACPCALVFATPTAVAAGIGGLVRRGMLCKGGATLETVGRLRTVVFDKTGTLTYARLALTEVVPAEGVSADDVLRLAASVENFSEHPLAQAVVARAAERGLSVPKARNFTAVFGRGAQAQVGRSTVRVGNLPYLTEQGIEVSGKLRSAAEEIAAAGASCIYVARGRRAVGVLAARDTIRSEAPQAVGQLKELGVSHLAVVSGDAEAPARYVGSRLGITDVRSALLPAEKVQVLEELKQRRGPVAMVGDGINDAPSLVTADVGITLREVGTDVAVASADLIIVGDDLRKIPEALLFGRNVLRVIWQNILGFAVGFNAASVVAASLGFITPVLAAVLHQVSSLLVCLNSLRLLADRTALRRLARRAGTRVKTLWIEKRRLILVRASVLLLAVYALSGFHVVPAGSVSVIRRFGKITRVAGPGLCWRLPVPFGSHSIVAVRRVRRTELGFRTLRERTGEPPAYEWNVQHRGGRYARQPAEAELWAGDETLVDVNAVLHWMVADAQQAVTTWGDDQKRWEKVLRVLAEKALRTVAAQLPLTALLSSERDAVQQAVKEDLERTLRRIAPAFRCLAVYLGDVHPPFEVVPSYREVAEAMEQKEARINEAEAYACEAVALARGKATAMKTQAEAEKERRVRTASGGAGRFTALQAAWAVRPDVATMRLYLDTVQSVLAGKRKIIVDKPPKGTKRSLLLGPKELWRILAEPGAQQGAGQQ